MFKVNCLFNERYRIRSKSLVLNKACRCYWKAKTLPPLKLQMSMGRGDLPSNGPQYAARLPSYPKKKNKKEKKNDSPIPFPSVRVPCRAPYFPSPSLLFSLSPSPSPSPFLYDYYYLYYSLQFLLYFLLLFL